MIKAVLIDDEPQSSKALAIKLSSLEDEVEIVATFSEPEKALNTITALNPDLVFLDIEMPGLNGFQFLEKIGEVSFEIIFITAYHEYALQALRISALDYLLKPVDIKELKQALIRVRQKLTAKQNTVPKKEQLQLFHEAMQRLPKRLALVTTGSVLFVKVDDIIHVEAMSNYTAFHLSSKQKIVVSKTLKEFEPFLLAHEFIKVNRSSIVNIEYVTELRKSDGCTIVLQNGTEIDISLQRKQEVLQKLNNF